MGTYDIFMRHRFELLIGLRTTLYLCLSIWTISVVVGVPFGLLAHFNRTVAGNALSAWGAALAGVPPIVLLFWLHYPAQAALSVVIDPFYTAIVALSLIGCFMVAAIIRDAAREFPREYISVARVCGMNRTKMISAIIVPLGARQVLPGMLTFLVSIFQMTLFASFISVNEIFRVAQRINSIEYSPTEVFTSLAIFCVAVSLPLHAGAAYLKRRFSQELFGR